ncbi:hypothetical protein ISN45_At04g022200 [Arabidopsis thaliana x Arabidopsis arenosa]|uniref:Uncharacterized protein n=2 Tax=Arabidopsis TaxID=3701 RepID=A0A8T2EE57_ARASU|nr:hypothetical protein ISN45_At04g022200 [Arabidopsis thaliana x Arabidopsis arenosa]KAG7621262.1 hypothetical protein ISN44_As04g021760 [Arabidopsis suecica]
MKKRKKEAKECLQKQADHKIGKLVAHLNDYSSHIPQMITNLLLLFYNQKF